MKAIAYARCSVDTQEVSIPDQKKEIQRWADANEIEIIEWFEDEGFSGRRAETRKAFMKMLKYVENNETGIEFCLVYDESRWGRFLDPQDSIYYKQYFKHRGVKVVFVTGMRDDGSMGVGLIQTVNSYNATEYSMSLSKTSFRGHKTFAEKGFWVAGSSPFGYVRALYDENRKFVKILKDGERKITKTQHTKLHINDAEAKVVRRIFELKASGKGIKGITNILNKEKVPTKGSLKGGRRIVSAGWSSSQVGYIVRKPLYKGTLIYNRFTADNLHEQDKKVLWGKNKPKEEWVVCENAVEPIVPEELFDKVQLQLEEQKRTWKCKGRPYNTPYLFSGLIHCKRCGSIWQGRTITSKGYRNVYYVCGGYINKGSHICRQHNISKEVVEEFALKYIMETRINNEVWRSSLKKKLEDRLVGMHKLSDKESKAITDEIKRIQKGIDNLLDFVAEGGDRKEVFEKIKEYEFRREKLLLRKKEFDKIVYSKGLLDKELAEIFSYLDDFKQVIEVGTWEEKKAWVRTFVARIEADPDKDTVDHYFYKIPQTNTLLSKTHPHHHYNVRATGLKSK